MPQLPPEVASFLAALDSDYESVFMVEYTSPCAACNGGKPRMVHRDPITSRLGGALRRLVDSYPELTAHKTPPKE